MGTLARILNACCGSCIRWGVVRASDLTPIHVALVCFRGPVFFVCVCVCVLLLFVNLGAGNPMHACPDTKPSVLL
jgi:hypothetical protein